MRLGEQPSVVGVDVRAALSTWGVGKAVLGGVALLGVQPPGCPRPLDAVIVLPRGVLVVVGVDLPDPAMRLEAPLTGGWAIDGWPLVRTDGAVNPATEALAAATTVANRLQAMRAEPLPVSTVIAVGPYVGKVVQPTVDLNRGVRVLHPEPTTLLAAARELATCERPCTVDQASRLLGVVMSEGSPPDTGQLLAEGFPDAVTTDLASASTMLIPRIGGKDGAERGAERKPRRPLPPLPHWAPYAAAGVFGLLVLLGIIVAATSGDTPSAAPPTTSARPTTVAMAGLTFAPEGAAKDTDCAGHSFGDARTWLTQHGCTGLQRAQYETSVNGRKVAVSVAEITVADAAAGAQLRAVLDTPGAGGVNDLVREGRTWPGGPANFDRAAYASSVQDNRIRVAQAVWADGQSTATDPALLNLAKQAQQLPLTQ
ncbi:hypothetical protein [Solihabitans fulvus]|uniref:hypothetical protein n=1 Tax=Solihabitans fulvus TaxID=1892852 RepID=UPI001CB75E3C|nr:hypothetical protein [Solihabitans fulvus]